ncbi:hypothetical protein EV702DRAFT_1181336 [Suillus placidus]|uniref:Uncharacterized protein n=1 Tax=Suillus placidus TaxID=48579 RepID=A0A9P6ZMD3_9AGAM|nr:hypothetical protein EV702DRAFT_1181336 [Suillus placidus]
MPEIMILKRPREEAVITQQMFFKKSAWGKVIKVLRKQYLRDDISCGIDDCRACDVTAQTVLSCSGDTTHKNVPTGHYILPNTYVFLAQMDLIESNFFTPPIIILQTVMGEALTTTDEWKVWVFYNKFRL